MTTERPAPEGRPFHIRAEAARRLPPLECGHADPWTASHNRPSPTRKQIDGYLQAAKHLESLGLSAAPLLPELRLIWQRGGADRRLAQNIAQRWEIAA